MDAEKSSILDVIASILKPKDKKPEKLPKPKRATWGQSIKTVEPPKESRPGQTWRTKP